ncbi:MAG: polysaccharide deacetylase family protein [Firmicutes bacterium]|nr:polysaccharide deacetylase family protein [Bacillota bacterium]MCL1953113.1 polysaccharide deacetylase family protein [Bacillota bacterium]
MKKFCISLSLVLLSIFLCLSHSSHSAPSVLCSAISWGLTHRGGGSVPQIPNGASELLSSNNGIYVGDTSKNKIYLTFDLGFEAGFTGQVLDELAQHDIKAIFFVCGNYLKESELIKRMIDEGHSIGNHTDKHLDLPKQDIENIKKDIINLDTKIQQKFPTENIKTTHFRPPFGRFCKNTLEQANSLGLKTVLWSNAIADWGKEPIDPTNCSDKLVKRLHNGCIVLLHITNSGTPKMLRQFILKALQAGFEFGNGNEL